MESENCEQKPGKPNLLPLPRVDPGPRMGDRHTGLEFKATSGETARGMALVLYKILFF